MGRALREFLPDAAYLSRQECDVREFGAISEYCAGVDVVIHTAALTDHQHPNAAEVIETNILGTYNVALACRAQGMKLVYLSTHYVYPGETGNYRETDGVRPIGTYAWSKLAGEAWAMLPDRYLIVRGSWYTYDTRVRHWIEKGALDDAFCSREPARDAAQKIAELVIRDATGIYNIGGPRRSFVEIAESECPDRKVYRKYRHEMTGLPYPFPADSSVNTDKFEALVGRT